MSEYPVIALMGAPGAFPVHEKDRWLQKFVKWSLKIEKKAKEFITSILQNEPFVGTFCMRFSNSLIIHAALTQPEHLVLVRWMGLETQ